MMEAYLRSADSKARPLRETAGLADAAQHVGGAGNGLFTYQNQREDMREFFTALKKSSPDSPSSGGANASGALPFAAPERIFSEWMDFSLLPDYRQSLQILLFFRHQRQRHSGRPLLQDFRPPPAAIELNFWEGWRLRVPNLNRPAAPCMESGASESFLRINQDAVMHHHDQVVFFIAGDIGHERFARFGQGVRAPAEGVLLEHLPAIGGHELVM